jgi:hypothetical protein
MFHKWLLFGGLLTTAATLAVVGCSKAQPTPEQAADHKDGDHKDGDHAHKPGAHGGTIVSLGKDSYHAEVVFEKDEVIRLYMLGKDESKTQEVEVQELVGHATPTGATDAVQVKFVAESPKGTAAGKTTQFVGKLPHELHGKKFKVVINNIQVGTERFRVEFSNEKTEKGGHKH